MTSVTNISNKGFNIDEEITCKPLDSYDEIVLFLQDPPHWRTLCKELTPHSNYFIRNIDMCAGQEFSLESPAAFCHYDPDAEEVQRYKKDKLPKTLVCHDMANGYHDDSVIHGTGQYDAYHFYNWVGIDIFCYFSHHLITIPPLAWINTGHAHGVKVIGTIITEWNDGVVFWEQILQSEQCYQDFASSLVAIAKTLKFDGWLLNIENKISKPDVLLKFVKHFHRILHEELSDPVLVWYDSVTVDGNLNWQNGLNEKNKDFFDACDGFFTNYSWTEDDVTSSARMAGDRVNDLYVGIDVFGRNFHGGGQFNTQKAVKLAHAAGCSLAIFAPAWTHEAMDQRPCDRLERFALRDRAFWGSLWPYLNTRPPSRLPFESSFCRGQGRRRWRRGDVVSPSPWFNLRHQRYQPGTAHGPHGYRLPQGEGEGEVGADRPPAPRSLWAALRRWAAGRGPAPAPRPRAEPVAVVGELECQAPHYADAFAGGCSLRVQPSDAADGAHRFSRLLLCDFRFEGSAVACVVTKRLREAPAQTLDVVLSVEGEAGEARPLRVALVGREREAPPSPSASPSPSGGGSLSLYPLDPAGAAFRDLRRYLLLNEPDLYVPVENCFGWTVRYYELAAGEWRVTAVSLRTGAPKGGILLGHLALCDRKSN